MRRLLFTVSVLLAGAAPLAAAPLQGGVQQSGPSQGAAETGPPETPEPDAPVCAAAYQGQDPRLWHPQMMPQVVGGGLPPRCTPPANWRLAGEDRGQCCYLEPLPNPMTGGVIVPINQGGARQAAGGTCAMDPFDESQKLIVCTNPNGGPDTGGPSEPPPDVVARPPPQTAPSGTRSPTQPPTQPPAQTNQPPRQWNRQPPACTRGDWNVATCTFTDNRGGKWTGPQYIQCEVANNTYAYPFRSQYQINPNTFSITTQAGGMIGHATLQLYQFYPANDPPANTITVDFVLQPSSTRARTPESYCPPDVYTTPARINY